MQSSPYLHPDRAVGKGKRKCGNVYPSRKRSKKDGGVSVAYAAGTGMDVDGAPPSKVGDESPLGSSESANVEAIVRVVADEGFPMGEVWVDDIEGCIHVRMVAEEGAAEAAQGTSVSGDLIVNYVRNSTDQGGDGGRQSPCDIVVDVGVVVTDEKSDEGVGKDGPEVTTQSAKGGTCDSPIVAGVDVVCCETHGTEAETNAGPSMQTFANVEGTVDEGRDGRGKPSAVAIVVTTSAEDSSPASSEAIHGRQPPHDNTPHVQEIGQVWKHCLKYILWQMRRGLGGGPSIVV
ncbi:hypothetical protein Cgig2_022649 [Carnegiea gigantea]|uniref:Uncharacterized protein n=1 Tax=Carnegiea gigantea TaxID=171969 RepID=A0A9Q1JPQ2_9CARY|nr:hypothetical protein Cgig2_022649 [Carnegiea gigantea]